MAKYNTKKIYNKNILNGGSNYNSGPFVLFLFEYGNGNDEINNIASDVAISDVGAGVESIVLNGYVFVSDNSLSIDEVINIFNNVEVVDLAEGNDSINLPPIIVGIADIGNGVEHISIADTFFIIDEDSRLQPLGVLVIGDSRYELLPATRDNVEEIPGKHGEIDFGSELKPRVLELHVATDEGYSKLEKAHLERLFAKYLNPTKGVKRLIFSDDVEKTYMVKYSGKIDLSKYPTWFKFVIPFKMSEPFIIGSFEKILVGSGTITNDGTEEAPLTIEIAGPVTNPSLTIGEDTLAYTGTIEAGEILTIVTGGKGGMTAKIGQENAMDNYNGVFPLLPPGSLNVVADNNVTIRWRDMWI